jgi:hypothetical protein
VFSVTKNDKQLKKIIRKNVFNLCRMIFFFLNCKLFFELEPFIFKSLEFTEVGSELPLDSWTTAELLSSYRRTSIELPRSGHHWNSTI